MSGRVNKEKVSAAAQKYVQKGQYDRAIREYMRIVDDDPRDVRIWLKIGDLHAKKKDTQQAARTYMKVAEFYSEQGFYLKAVAVYKQILKLDPSQVDINIKLAELYKQLGLLSDAMQQYELVSHHYHQAGRTKDALTALRQIVDLDPENVASRIKLAELYSKEQMVNEAVEEFIKAADYLRASDRIDDFLKVAERLIFHQPENVSITKELASLYLRRKDPRRALQKLQLAFKAEPRDETTLAMLAQAFEDLQQIPKTVSVLKELANIQAEGSDPKRARETYRRVLALDPNDLAAREALAASEGLSNSQSPQVSVQQPLGAEAAPGAHVGPPAGVSIGGSGNSIVEKTAADEITRVFTESDVYIKYGLYDKAIERLRHVFSLDPHNSDAHLRLKELFVQQKKMPEAARQLCALARHTAQSNKPDAAKLLNEALEIDPRNRSAQLLLSELEGRPTAEAGAAAEEDMEILDLQPEDMIEEIATGDNLLQEIPSDAVEMELAPNAPMANDAAVNEFGVIDLAAAEGAAMELPTTPFESSSAASPAEVVPIGIAEEPVAAPPSSLASSFDDEVEEVDFFMQQNLLKEARVIVDDLLANHPNHPQVLAKHQVLLQRESATKAEGKRYPRVTASIVFSLDDVVGPSLTNNAEVPLVDVSVDQAVAELNEGVKATQLADEDSETHYDLGIAYREMGMVDEAITEFKTAMRAAHKEPLCRMMIGLCHLQQGNAQSAVTEFTQGLRVAGIKAQEKISLLYELALAHEQLGDSSRARDFYQQVNAIDPHFREVAQRLAS